MKAFGSFFRTNARVWSFFLLIAFVATLNANEECELDFESLNRYESEILKAAADGKYEKMAEPLACILKMQSEGGGLSQYLANSFLAPLMGAGNPAGIITDRRYKTVAKALEELSVRTADATRRSFVSEFSKGDWRFYTLFCEQGNTEYCSVFLPDEKKVKSEAPLMAAASMLRLKTAYSVLKGKQRELIAKRIKNLYREIPENDRLRRKFIEEIYRELFEEIPLSKA